MAEETVAQMIARAAQLVREKRRVEARDLLLQVVERDERCEQAWLWLGWVVEDPRDMQVALANALTINPNSEQARKGLEQLRERYGDLLVDVEPEAAPVSKPAAPAPPAPSPGEDVVVFQCYKCRAEIEVVFTGDGGYHGLTFCFGCRAAVHCCDNCVRHRETDCKEGQGIRGPAAAKTRNNCPQWRPG